jgi:hypothetical protein
VSESGPLLFVIKRSILKFDCVFFWWVICDECHKVIERIYLQISMSWIVSISCYSFNTYLQLVIVSFNSYLQLVVC